MCKFGGDPAICLREAICAKCLQTDRQTDDGRRAIVLANWNELKTGYLEQKSCNLWNGAGQDKGESYYLLSAYSI